MTSKVFHWVLSSSAEIKLLVSFRQVYEDHSDSIDCNQEESSSPGQGSFWSWDIWIRGSMTVLNSVLWPHLLTKRANPNLSFLTVCSITGSDSLGLGIPGPKRCRLLEKGGRPKGKCLLEAASWTLLLYGIFPQATPPLTLGKTFYLGFMWRWPGNVWTCNIIA